MCNKDGGITVAMVVVEEIVFDVFVETAKEDLEESLEFIVLRRRVKDLANCEIDVSR